MCASHGYTKRTKSLRVEAIETVKSLRVEAIETVKSLRVVVKSLIRVESTKTVKSISVERNVLMNVLQYS